MSTRRIYDAEGGSWDIYRINLSKRCPPAGCMKRGGGGVIDKFIALTQSNDVDLPDVWCRGGAWHLSHDLIGTMTARRM